MLQTVDLRNAIQLTTGVVKLWMRHLNGGTLWGRLDQRIAEATCALGERSTIAQVRTKRASRHWMNYYTLRRLPPTCVYLLEQAQ